MKKLTLLFFMIAMSVVTYAAIEKEIQSEIKNVTVYQQGAQISRAGSITLQRGKTVLLYKGLPSGISPESIQAKANNDVMIVSVTHRIDYLNKTVVSKEISSLNERRRLLQDSIRMLKNYKTVYAQEKEMILSNKSIAGENGVNINELEQAARFFRKTLTEIESKTHRLDNILFELKSEMVNISRQLLELNAKIYLPASIVSVVVSSETDTQATMELNYFIADAGWLPSYDIRIKDVSEPLSLFYKAKVFQNTDENWDDVNLVLSTGNPSISNNKPELAAYYLTFNNYYSSNKPYASGKVSAGTVRGRVISEDDGEGLPGATVIVKGTTTGVVTDIEGNFQLDIPQGYNTIVVSFIGFKPVELQGSTQMLNISLTPDTQQLDEVVVMGYGVSDESSYEPQRSSAAAVRKKEQIPLAIEKQQLTTEFRINIPYSIPSDNQAYDVTMVEYDIDAEYKYSAVPKLSPDAFLVARIPDYLKYNLLSGSANIFFKGIYQGESFIDLNTSTDTLVLSVGRDKDIVVLREIQKDFTSKNIAGSSKKEQKAWTITVKNNKNIPIDILIEDQYPVSKTDEIKVDLIEYSEAVSDESTGKLTWNLSMNPNEKKELNLRYSVKYPSGRPVLIE